MDLTSVEIAELARQVSGPPGARGYHHANHVVTRDGRTFVVRIPLDRSFDADLRMWPEWQVLPIARRHGLRCPQVYGVDPSTGAQVHEYIQGDVVDATWPRGSGTPEPFVAGAAAILLALRHVPGDALPPRPSGWPQSGDAPQLFRRLLAHTRAIWEREGERHARAFAALGVPPDPLACLAPLSNRLRGRPFVLCHADIHRGNCVLDQDGRIVLLDWEIALFGDPAFELATHIHKTGYTVDDEARLLACMAEHEDAGESAALFDDMHIYRAHERVKSVIVDVVRYRERVAAAAGTDQTARWLAARLAAKLRDAASVWHGDAASEERVEEVLRA